MTNAEMYKTVGERTEAFLKFCEGKSCLKCKLQGYKTPESVCGEECAFRWLTLEVEELLKPCPFCGSEAGINSGTEDHYVVCQNGDCAAALIARSFSSVEEAIDAWNRRS